MKRILVAVIVLVVLDFGLGALLKVVNRHVYTGAPAGDVNGTLAAVDQGVDVIMLGSSTAQHGYDPREMEPILMASVYNAGSDGMWYDYAYGLMHLISTKEAKEEVPSLWVMNLDLPTLFYDRRSAGHLAPFMDEDPVVHRLVANTVSHPVERLRFLSRLVRYNGVAISFLKHLVRPKPTEQGYEPLYGTVDGSLDKGITFPSAAQPVAYQVEMLTSLNRLATQMGARLILVIPPAYLSSEADREGAAELLAVNREFARALEVPLLDYSASAVPAFTNPALFRDQGHLNHEGAQLFSQMVARDLQPFLQR